jgi:hypothetical protein
LIVPDIPRPNPELMIIGDSLAQGCRSLTVNQAFCAQSWAARIAQAQEWNFVPPDLPRPILFDLEEEIRRLDTLTLSVENFTFEGIISRIRDNLGAWLNNAQESAFDCFDNLGLSGALIYDLYTRSAATSALEVAQLTPQGSATKLPLDSVGDLHLAINGRFTLNPSQEPGFDDFTPLQWVRARQPRRLLVQIGHNHGLYQIGSKAEDVSFEQPGGDGSHGDYWAQWQTMAANLAALPAEVGTIVVALLPKVGAVANLDPREASRDENGYAPTYGPVFSTSTSILTGERLAAIDQAISEANGRIQQIVGDAANAAGTGARVKFLDTYAVFDRFDYKNSLDPARQVNLDTNVILDNRYVDGRFHFLPLNMAGWRLSAGGLESVDGMHPSGCGYVQLASEAMNLLGLEGDGAALLQQAFGEDTLLSHYPIELRAVTSLLQMARDLSRTNAFFHSGQTFLTEGLHGADVLRMMLSTFLP